MDTQIKSLKIATAKRIKKYTSDDNNESYKEDKKVKVKYSVGSTQDMIPIKEIKDGVIITTDGRYVSIVEIAPVNFFKLSSIDQDKRIEGFHSLFKLNRNKWQIKVINNPSNASDLVRNIKKADRYGRNKELDETINHYVDYVNDAGKAGASNTRYFIIFEYEGKERDFKAIANEMYKTRIEINSNLQAAGSYIITEQNFDAEQLEYLYMYFNRNTSVKETLQNRIDRLVKDYNKYNSVSEQKKNITVSDMVASKGIQFTNRHYVYMDGIYYGFMGFTTYPTEVPAAWLNLFSFGNMVDLDVIIKKLPRNIVRGSLKFYNTYTTNQKGDAARHNKIDKYLKYNAKLNNNRNIEQKLNSGQDLYDVGIIITVRGRTARELGDYMRRIESILKTRANIKVDTCFDCAEEYFAMTMPLLFITKPFKRIKHNFLTEELAPLYPMTAFNLYDPRGWVPGINKENSSLCAINLFNHQLYNNANLVIFGAPGTGKTFTLKLMSTRLYYNGVDCYFIIPKKGYDFISCCNITGGSYVPMFPMGKTCVNIMEIRPEKLINKSALDENTIVDQRSLLGKKVTTLTTWLSLVTQGKTENIRINNKLNNVITKLYESFGITDDNDSIYEIHNGVISNKLKTMPILQDLYDALAGDEDFEYTRECLMPFIDGNFRNFNGQTNINLDSDFICFDCDEDEIGKTLHPAVMYIAFDFCYSRVKSPSSGRSIIVMDEVWKMMQTEDSAEQVQNMVKLVRGYLSATCIATQEIKDLLRIKGGQGESVIDDSSTKLILGLEKHGLDLVAEKIGLTAEDKAKIEMYKTGTGLLVSRGQKTEILIQPSPFEAQQFSDKTRSAMNA
jgi:hypothetical protein